MVDDVLHSIVPARTSARTQTELPRRQIDVIDHDEHILKFEAVSQQQVSDGRSAAVHEGERLRDADGVTADASPFELDIATLVLVCDRCALGDGPGAHAADAVPWFHVLESRVAMADCQG